MKYKFINKKILDYGVRRDKGIALLVAILTMGIALTIGVGALNIALKQSQLASIGKGSTKAFFAADTGLECALYWDIGIDSGLFKSIFATSSDSSIPIAGSGLDCNTDIVTDLSIAWNVPPLPPPPTPTAATTTFTLKFGVDADPCATITIAKYKSGGSIRTNIVSLGLNSCDPTNPRRVERGVSLSY